MAEPHRGVLDRIRRFAEDRELTSDGDHRQAAAEPPLPRQLAVEALAGASAAVVVALLVRKAHAARRRHVAPDKREPDGAPGTLLRKLAEFAVLRLVFRSVFNGVRWSGKRLVA